MSCGVSKYVNETIDNVDFPEAIFAIGDGANLAFEDLKSFKSKKERVIYVESIIDFLTMEINRLINIVGEKSDYDYLSECNNKLKFFKYYLYATKKNE
jgi:hypothetical protein